MTDTASTQSVPAPDSLTPEQKLEQTREKLLVLHDCMEKLIKAYDDNKLLVGMFGAAAVQSATNETYPDKDRAKFVALHDAVIDAELAALPDLKKDLLRSRDAYGVTLLFSLGSDGDKNGDIARRADRAISVITSYDNSSKQKEMDEAANFGAKMLVDRDTLEGLADFDSNAAAVFMAETAQKLARIYARTPESKTDPVSAQKVLERLFADEKGFNPDGKDRSLLQMAEAKLNELEHPKPPAHKPARGLGR